MAKIEKGKGHIRTPLSISFWECPFAKIYTLIFWLQRVVDNDKPFTGFVVGGLKMQGDHGSLQPLQANIGDNR